MSKITVGNRIKDARRAKGITQKQLARLLDCAHTTISKYEQGEIENMPRPRMKQMAEVLGVPPVVLFELEQKGKPEDKQRQSEQSELSLKKREFMQKVEGMTDAQIERLEQILALVENIEQ